MSRFFSQIPQSISPETDVETLLLREYGSVFVARNVTPPPKIVFSDQSEVNEFQNSLEVRIAVIGGFELELQSRAMEELLAAIDDAGFHGITISPRGQDSARRDYDGTVELWASRVNPALDHWVDQARLEPAQAERIRSMPPFRQVPEILQLESEGIWFAKDLSKSIIYSVAPPGTSQHLAMLAFDVKEFADKRVRKILADHGWFQTVVSDLPHFTFLGVEETALTGLGLRREESGDQVFWVPDL